ncbi:MAG: aminopeptidase [Clostridia bacterium]|nr:aminopeptidase [Clostridia bacterium]
METNLWKKYEAERDKIEGLCAEYKEFLSTCKTERECIRYAVSKAREAGVKSLAEVMAKGEQLVAGDSVYAINMDKAIVMFTVGKRPIEEGINIIGAHIDSPRLDLKCTPVYENTGFCLFDTHYYGGIKKYQWTAIPLALHGVVCKKDGTRIDVNIGDNEDDPVLGISDLLPHLDRKPENKMKDVKGEDLNVLVGTISDENAEKDKVKATIMSLLKEKGIEEDDFFSAEIEVVPAGKARDFGLDRSMIMAYGQDDRVCAYTSLRAWLETKNPEYSTMCLLVDKEEIGSVGATGMASLYFENALAEIMNATGQYSELALRRALNRSQTLSSDVTAAVDPNNLAPFNVATDAHFGKGISFNKYTGAGGKSGANDANPEFISRLRRIMDDANVTYQATEMGRVDEGGGGTIAYIMAKYGMDVIDAGVPVLNMHAPFEITSKVDVYEAYRAYVAFFASKK